MIFGACLIKNTKIYIHNLIIRSVHLHTLTSNNCSDVSLNVYPKHSLLNDTGISSSLYSKLLSHVNEHHLCHNVGESGCLENSGSVVQIFFYLNHETLIDKATLSNSFSIWSEIAVLCFLRNFSIKITHYIKNKD